MTKRNRLLLVGNPGLIHVGSHFERASQQLGLQTYFCDTEQAFKAPWPLAKINWWLRGHRPAQLENFSDYVLKACQEFKPDWLLSTGLAPITAKTLEAIGQLSVLRLNFLTDDPWNPWLRTGWFFQALPFYDFVFSPRRSTLNDLMGLRCSRVSFLPFAYAPELHSIDSAVTAEERDRLAADVVFAGGADEDRIPYIAALIQAGFKVSLYGGYWERHRQTRAYSNGHASPEILRKAMKAAKVCLCLVRRSNRDGHVMRSFEVPAMGGCMLAEDSVEHREIFGEDGQAAVYFSTIAEMIEKLHWLLGNEGERQRLAGAAHQLITQGNNTYADRLATMLALSGEIP
jgi:spore maturation protein CgeB